MKKKLFLLLLFPAIISAQKKTISGQATDSTKGANVIEIVVNDTLSKIMKDPKNGRHAYLRLYQDPRFVVRTDSSGTFKIEADENDSLYFKSYRHLPKKFLVRDLLRMKTINIVLEPDPKPED